MLAAIAPARLLSGWKIGTFYSNDNRELWAEVGYHRLNR
jgi:hypothetical protein